MDNLNLLMLLFFLCSLFFFAAAAALRIVAYEMGYCVFLVTLLFFSRAALKFCMRYYFRCSQITLA